MTDPDQVALYGHLPGVPKGIATFELLVADNVVPIDIPDFLVEADIPGEQELALAVLMVLPEFV